MKTVKETMTREEVIELVKSSITDLHNETLCDLINEQIVCDIMNIEYNYDSDKFEALVEKLD